MRFVFLTPLSPFQLLDLASVGVPAAYSLPIGCGRAAWLLFPAADYAVNVAFVIVFSDEEVVFAVDDALLDCIHSVLVHVVFLSGFRLSITFTLSILYSFVRTMSIVNIVKFATYF